MFPSAGPPVSGFATASSISAAINIPEANRCRSPCPCRCGCTLCFCHNRGDTDESNREEYGGEGTPLAGGRLATTQSTSYVSANSLSSVEESSNAPIPRAPATIAQPSYDTIRSIHGRQDPTDVAQINMERFLDDECPWDQFLEEDTASDIMSEDPAFFGPIEVEDSMRNNAPPSSGEHSMLSSFTSSISLRNPSVGMSDIVHGVGGVFGPRGAAAEPGHRYLRLN